MDFSNSGIFGHEIHRALPQCRRHGRYSTEQSRGQHLLLLSFPFSPDFSRSLARHQCHRSTSPVRFSFASLRNGFTEQCWETLDLGVLGIYSGQFWFGFVAVQFHCLLGILIRGEASAKKAATPPNESFAIRLPSKSREPLGVSFSTCRMCDQFPRKGLRLSQTQIGFKNNFTGVFPRGCQAIKF